MTVHCVLFACVVPPLATRRLLRPLSSTVVECRRRLRGRLLVGSLQAAALCSVSHAPSRSLSPCSRPTGPRTHDMSNAAERKAAAAVVVPSDSDADSGAEEGNAEEQAIEQLGALQSSLTQLETLLSPLLHTPLQSLTQQLPPLQAAKLQAALAYATNALFFSQSTSRAKRRKAFGGRADQRVNRALS